MSLFIFHPLFGVKIYTLETSPWNLNCWNELVVWELSKFKKCMMTFESFPHLFAKISCSAICCDGIFSIGFFPFLLESLYTPCVTFSSTIHRKRDCKLENGPQMDRCISQGKRLIFQLVMLSLSQVNTPIKVNGAFNFHLTQGLLAGFAEGLTKICITLQPSVNNRYPRHKPSGE